VYCEVPGYYDEGCRKSQENHNNITKDKKER
jgi:hypothetical protein